MEGETTVKNRHSENLSSSIRWQTFTAFDRCFSLLNGKHTAEIHANDDAVVVGGGGGGGMSA